MMRFWIITSSILSATPPDKEYQITKLPGATFCSIVLKKLIKKDVIKFPKNCKLKVVLSLGGNSLFPGRLLRTGDKTHHHEPNMKRTEIENMEDLVRLVKFIEKSLEERNISYNLLFFPLFPRVPDKCCPSGLNYPLIESLVKIRNFELQLKSLKICQVVELHKTLARYIKTKNLNLKSMGILNPTNLKYTGLFNHHEPKLIFFRSFQKKIFAKDQVHMGQMGKDILQFTLDSMCTGKSW